MKKAKVNHTRANQKPTLTDDIDLVLNYQSPRSKMPSGGTSKKDTRCPKCFHNSYRFHGRWKRCRTCGLDNCWESVVRFFRSKLQNSRAAGKNDRENIHKVAEYIRQHLWALSGKRGRNDPKEVTRL